MYVLLCLGTSTTARDSRERGSTGILRPFLFFIKPGKFQGLSMDIFGLTAVVSHFFHASPFATVSLHKLGPCGICQLSTPSLLESFFVIPFALSCFACAHLPPGAHRAQAASFRDQCLHYSKDCLKRNVHAVSLYHPEHRHIPSMTYRALDSKNLELVIHAPEAFTYQSQTYLEVHKIDVKLPLLTCSRSQHYSLQTAHTWSL